MELRCWVTSAQQNPVIGTLLPGTYILRVSVHVTVAFTSDGTDTLTVGWDSDTDAIMTSLDVSSTGVFSGTLGANAGYNGTAQQIEAYYVNSGSEPGAGKAIVILELVRVPMQP